MSTASLLAWRMMRAGQHHAPMKVDVRYGTDILAANGPQSFSEFIGQEQACRQLSVAVLAASARKEPLPHVLLASGAPGIGKTTLARLTAFNNGGGYVELGGPVKASDVVPVLRAMKDGDVLFLDEIHQLVSVKRVNAEWLLQLLQDGNVVLPTGVVTAPRITVIGATTDAQKLPRTILDRFTIQPVLEPYTPQQAVQIAQLTAKRIGITLAEAQYHRIAAAADYNPRVMNRLLGTVRDLQVTGEPEASLVDTALSFVGVTHDGLTRLEQDYLMLLMGYGGTASVGTMRAVLNENVLDHTERTLIGKGFLTISSKGREITQLGAERAQELLDEENA